MVMNKTSMTVAGKSGKGTKGMAPSKVTSARGASAGKGKSLARPMKMGRGC